jgi:DNA helicase-2/ATP-dependent DNA helicase PcrA
VTVADEAAQARWVTDEVLRQREAGLLLRRQAVLFRTSQHSAPLELELTRRRVPFVKYGGLKFLEASHVKDLLSLLRFAQNPSGQIAGFRCALLVPGIGPATARRLLSTLAEASSDPTLALHRFKPPAAARADWTTFTEAYAALREPGAPWPAQVETALAWYRPQLDRLHEDAPVRLADLQQLCRMASAFPSRERFLAELTLDPPQASSDEAGVPHRDEDYLILSTIHSAKGQEWSAVHVLNVVDGCMPADMATGSAAEIDEERRLLYVAMTRAKRHLHLIVPQRFHVTQQARLGDRHLYAVPSRFLTPAAMARLDTVTAARPIAETSTSLPPASTDVSAAIRARWS